MTAVARLIGVLVFGLGLAGLAMTLLGDLQGRSGPIPSWNDWAWTAALRLALEYLSFAALAAAGLIMRVRLDGATGPLVVVVGLAAARIGYDWLIAEANGARLEPLLRMDLAFAMVVTLGLFACLVAQDEAAALAAAEAGRGPGD